MSSDDPHGIKRRRAALGWSERELAQRAGVLRNGHPYFQAVQRLERLTEKGGVPGGRYLRRLLAALEAGESDPNAYLQPPPSSSPAWVEWVSTPSSEEIEPPRADIIVYAMKPTESGGMELTNHKVGFLPAPRHVQAAYAAQIWGSGMVPKYHSKDVVMVNPDAPPRPFGGVLIMSKDHSDVHVGQYIGETHDEWIIEQFGADPADRSISRKEKRLPRTAYPEIHAIVAVITDLMPN